jgi:hypothetical protein
MWHAAAAAAAAAAVATGSSAAANSSTQWQPATKQLLQGTLLSATGIENSE